VGTGFCAGCDQDMGIQTPIRDGTAVSLRSSKGPFGPAGTPTIAVVGAGFAGIGLAVLLKKAHIHTFTVYEVAESVGGAWWHNQYPGAEVDTVSFIYSYAFKPNGWTRTHAKQPELLRYLNDTVDQFGIRAHLRLGVGVDGALWDETEHIYRLTLSTGETAECNVLIGATGFLNIPKYPMWPGLDCFLGPKFHTARWESDHDLAGKTVAIVGTGSTATQLVPELAKYVSKLYVFQREPGWVTPKGDRDYTVAEQARFAKPWFYRLERLKFFAADEKRLWRGGPARLGTRAHNRGEQAALDFIEQELGDRPDLKKAVTPTYPFLGKRVIRSSTFYAALKSDNVELVPRAVTSVTPTGLVDEDGVECTVDVLVMATGFQATNYLGTLVVRGRDGRTLQEYWDGEPRAFLGMTVPNFPNFFMQYGPGTNGGEVARLMMQQAEHIVRTVKRMSRDSLTAVEVRPKWAARYHSWLMSAVNATAWNVGNNYFRSPSGKIVTQWPFGSGAYGLLVRLLGQRSEMARRLPRDE
jgi:cation diffusion facilitator CzcD-associated flavoprotein CzcO